MESALALKLCEDLYTQTESKTIISERVTGDDTTMRAYLSHENRKGELKSYVPAPKFLVDPGHRLKLIIKPIMTKVSKTKHINRVKKT